MCFCAGELDHLSADAFVLVEGLHIDTTDFGYVTAIVDLKVDASHDAAVNFVDKIVSNRSFDGFLRTLTQALRADAVLCDIVNRMGICSDGAANGLVVVAVNHCSDANLVKNFVKQCPEEASVKNVRAGRASFDCFDRVFDFTK